MRQIATRRSTWIWTSSVVAILFGLVTIKAGGTILFGDDAVRAAAGDYVPFVLRFNFIAGFAYIITGVELWQQRPLAAWLAAGIALTTALTFSLFGAHILAGGAYELRTVIAMSLRTLVWTAIALIAWHQLIHLSKRSI